MKDAVGSVKVGVVGVGTIARSGHIPRYAQSGRAAIQALCDVDTDRAERAAQEMQRETGREAPRVYPTLTAMLAAERLDAVSITAPNTLHVALAMEALEAGTDVLVEKPMATSPADAEALVEAEARTGHRVLVGMTHRFRQDVEALKRFIDAGALGRIYHANARLLVSRGIPQGWFRHRALSGGGALWDNGVHVLDLAWYLMGRPTPAAVSGHLERAIPPDDVDFIRVWSGAMGSDAPSDVEEFGAAWIRFTNGATLMLQVAWAAHVRSDNGILVEVLGSEGGVSLSPLRLYSQAHRVLTETVLEVPAGDAMQREINHFLRVVRREEEPLVSAREGAAVVRLLDGIGRSSAARQEVGWDH